MHFTQQEPQEEGQVPVIKATNSTNLGMSEVQLIQNMYDGIRACLENEKKIAAEKKAIADAIL